MSRRQVITRSPSIASRSAEEGEEAQVDDQSSPVNETLVEQELASSAAPGEDRVYKLDSITAEATDDKVQASDGNGASSATPAVKAAPAGGTKGRGAALSLTQANTMPKTISVPAGKFGACQPTFSFENVEVVIPGDGTQPKVNAALKVQCAWGVADGPNNITGPSDPELDDANKARRAANDLEPRLTPDGKPTREKYWSKFWTQEHEWFHARDTFAWATEKGIPLAEKWLATDYITDQEAAERSLRRIAGNLLDAWSTWFGADLEEESDKPGEQRCYAQFKANYQDLADGLRKRAGELEKK